MELKNDFEAFLSGIRPTKNQKDDMKTGHKTLRDRLREYENLSPYIISDFLQGSYRRSTAVRPKNDKKADVDIIVVTSLSEGKYTPADVLELFRPFVKKYYGGKYHMQGRSIGIELSYVELDLVITSAPEEADKQLLKSDAVRVDEDIEEAQDWRLNTSWVALDRRYEAGMSEMLAKAKTQAEWKSRPLRIPDRDAQKWESTHPLEQIRWTRDKNRRCNGHFVNVVKALKWWRLEKYTEPKNPKGFPLERLIGEHCPDGIESVAEGATRTLEGITEAYSGYVSAGKKPFLSDYGVPTFDVFKRIEAEDFASFYTQVEEGAATARKAFDSDDRIESGNLWRELLGEKFPKPPDSGGTKIGFTEPSRPARPAPKRFA
ncbi:MAG: nucleotidyltransferase [Syntrophorhabdales bacterium]|jgi:hypothetical protein